MKTFLKRVYDYTDSHTPQLFKLFWAGVVAVGLTVLCVKGTTSTSAWVGAIIVGGWVVSSIIAEAWEAFEDLRK